VPSGTIFSMSDWEDAATAERILAQTTAVLANRGDEQAVALLIDVRSLEFVNTEEVAASWHDQVWGETMRYEYFLDAKLDVEDHLVARFNSDVCERIASVLGYVAERNDVAHVKYVSARVALPEVDDQWRETYAARLTADHPTNQARRERGLAQYPTEDGLTFGSEDELRVYRSLRRLQARSLEDDTIAILPSPGARLRAGHIWTPDFVVVGRRRALVIEVDGPHHRERLRRVDDANRDLQWFAMRGSRRPPGRRGCQVRRRPGCSARGGAPAPPAAVQELSRQMARSP
jgi:hypothetical protein